MSGMPLIDRRLEAGTHIALVLAHIEVHGHDDDDALNHVLPEGVNVHKVQAIGNHANDEHTDEHTRGATYTAIH